MEKYSMFEFTKNFFNEVAFLQHVNQCLWNISLNDQDDILLSALDDSPPFDVAKFYIEVNGYSLKIKLSIDNSMNLDFQKITSILNESIIFNKTIPGNFQSLIKTTIRDFKNQFAKCSWLKNYNFIISNLVDFEKEISERYFSEDVTKHSVAVNNIKKIQWKFGPGSLGTFFRSLNELHSKKKGIKCIDATSKDLERIITTCFVDEKGEPFSADSIYAYVSGKKTVKDLNIELKLIDF